MRSPASSAVPVLMYHHVCPNPGLVTLAPEVFEAQMAAIARAGYAALRADEFAGFLEGTYAPPARSVLITFDDGYLDNYVHAYPVLRRYGLRATIFVVTGWMGEGPARPHAGEAGSAPQCPDHKSCKRAVAGGEADSVMLRWSEIERMAADGAVEVHCHTHTHTRWDQQLPEGAERTARMEEDLAWAQDTLQARLGRRTRHLAWPQGYYEPAYQQVASRLGLTAQYTTRSEVNVSGHPLQEIGRIPVKDWGARAVRLRLAMYSRPGLARLYSRLRGRQ